MCSLSEFLSAPGPILDVRTPNEFAHAHIPGACNLPLFSNEERCLVGTCYKQKSKEEAVALGLDFLAEKMEAICKKLETKALRIHCWRGGMRSSSLTLLAKTLGTKACSLSGGYKAFRRWALKELEKPRNFRVLGGFTGSGKTEMLPQMGGAYIDLEKLANHRGSSFGNIGKQPSQEQFENLLAWELSQLKSGPIWIEDESRLIGQLIIPQTIFDQMQLAELHVLDVPSEERLERIVSEYGKMDVNELVRATFRIEKRLGSQLTRHIVSSFQKGYIRAAMKALLPYYDKRYLHSMQKRPGPTSA